VTGTTRVSEAGRRKEERRGGVERRSGEEWSGVERSGVEWSGERARACGKVEKVER